MSDWPKALAKEGEALERCVAVVELRRTLEKMGQEGEVDAALQRESAARAALVEKVRRLMRTANYQGARDHAYRPEVADALLSEEDGDA